MKQVEENKIRFWFTIKKLSNAFLFFFGTMTVIPLAWFLYLKITNYRLVHKMLSIDPPGYWEAQLNNMNNVLLSMLISGIIGIVVFACITAILSRRLKILQSVYIKQNYRYNIDFIRSHQNSIKAVKPPKFN